jgi:hypothetical protein
MRKVLLLAIVLISVVALAWATDKDEKFIAGEPQEEMQIEQKWSPEYGPAGELLNGERAIVPFATAMPGDQPDEPPTIQTVVLFEDFELPSGWRGDTPPAGWTVLDSANYATDPGLWNNFDWYRYAASAWGVACGRVTATSAVADDWFITPSVDFSGTTTCSLFYRYYYDDFTTVPEDTAMVLLSDDGGATWGFTVVKYAGVDSGTLTVPKLAAKDISSFAAGKGDIKAAFRYYKPVTTTAGGFGFDNVRFVGDVTELLNENMDGAWGTYGDNPPAGWTILDFNSPYADVWNNNDWHQNAPSGWGNIARIYYTAPLEQQNEWLISPAVNLSPAADQVLLKFKQFYNDEADANNTDSGFVFGSTDGGASWGQLIDTYTGADRGTSAAPDYASYDITAWANGLTNVAFAFKYVGNNDLYWYVDSVQVELNTLASDDVATTAINSPNFVATGYNWDLNVQVFNNGTATATFEDTAKITDLPRATFLFEDFEDPIHWLGDNPPAGWAVLDSGNAGDGWNNNDWHGYTHSSAGTETARFYYTPVEDYQNEWLISPAIDLTGQTNAYFSMRCFWNWIDASDSFFILITTDNWTTTNIAALHTADFGATPALPTLIWDITPWAAGNSNVQIAMKVVAATPGSPYGYFDDMQIYSILPTTEVYSSGETVSNLLSLESRAVQYAQTWNDPDAGDYNITTYTNLATDSDFSNDTMSAAVTSYEHFETGGPDAEYYSWASDKDGGSGSPFSWVDITAIGTPVTFNLGSADDRYTSGIDMGFSFYFYGNTFSRLFISENGFATFDSITTTVNYTNSVIPSSSGSENLLALFWDDLSGLTSGTAYFYSNNVDTFIVSFIDWDFYSDPAQRIDAQMILCGSDASIKFQYLDIGPVIIASHTIGIENADYTVGLQFEFNFDPPGNVALPGLAISFLYNPPDHDLATTAFLAPPGSGMINDPIVPQVTFTNFGSQSETNVPVRLIITPGTYNDVQIIPSIDPLGTYDVTFSSFTPTTSDVYTLTAVAELGGDVIPSNDTLVMTYAALEQLLDFEASDGGFEPSGEWEWGTPTSGPNGAFSGVNCWATNLEGNYVQGVSFLQFPLQIGAGTSAITFTHWYDTELRYDGGNFAVSTDNGATWNVIEPFDRYDTAGNSSNPLGQDRMFTGHGQGYWEVSTFPLSDYAGQTVLARLGFGADASVFYPGWYVDDMGFINCSVFRPANEVELVSIDGPLGEIVEGESYPVTATVRNRGSNIVSFNVHAADNRTYTNDQAVTDLAPDASIQLTFANWTIDFACSTYTLTVTTQLGGDEDPSNDSKSSTFEAMPTSNHSMVYDDGVIDNAWRFLPPYWIIANEFNVAFQGATLNSVTYLFTNLDNFPTWPNTTRDSVELYIFTDADADGLPDDLPVASKRTVPPDHGPVIWNVSCDANVIINCESFWAGWALIDSLLPEGICMDAATDFPTVSWTRRAGVWAPEDAFDGDDAIRAYLTGDPTLAADIALGSLGMAGEAQPGEADTVSNTLDNAGPGCDLEYTVRVVQNYTPLAGFRGQGLSAGLFDVSMESANPLRDPLTGAEPIRVETITTEKGTTIEPEYPPIIASSGGPDIYGYTWIDSDEPSGGPTFNWVDISAIGIEITTWPHGSIDDGYTDLISMGTIFEFYGIEYSDILISTNGWVSFVTQTSSYLTNAAIPNPANPNTIIAVEWDDLDGGTVGHCYYYYDSVTNQFIVSWVGWPYYPDPIDPHDLQVVLDCNTGVILTQYRNNAGAYQADVTVGIENHDGTDGLQVANAQVYLHNDLALQYTPPVFWLSTDLADGVLPPADPPIDFNVFMNAAELDTGIYNGAVVIESNDPDEPVSIINVQFVVVIGGGGCEYVPGDINYSGAANGIDVTYGVAYFKGGTVPPLDCNPPCTGVPDPFYAAGDVNGNCNFNGIDITFFVSYLKGGQPALLFCPDCPPEGLAAPAVMPILEAKSVKAGNIE